MVERKLGVLFFEQLEHLGDGSLDRHGMNPGDGGVSSILQTGS